MAGKFEVYKDKAGEFRFRLKAANGQTILTGEGYKAKDGVLNGIESVRSNAPLPERYEVREGSGDKCHFVLKAANHQIIGQSQRYESTAACDNGMKSVATNAPDAPIEELE